MNDNNSGVWIGPQDGPAFPSVRDLEGDGWRKVEGVGPAAFFSDEGLLVVDEGGPIPFPPIKATDRILAIGSPDNPHVDFSNAFRRSTLDFYATFAVKPPWWKFRARRLWRLDEKLRRKWLAGAASGPPAFHFRVVRDPRGE